MSHTPTEHLIRAKASMCQHRGYGTECLCTPGLWLLVLPNVSSLSLPFPYPGKMTLNFTFDHFPLLEHLPPDF